MRNQLVTLAQSKSGQSEPIEGEGEIEMAKEKLATFLSSEARVFQHIGSYVKPRRRSENEARHGETLATGEVGSDGVLVSG
jgi:hypothetical protein